MNLRENKEKEEWSKHEVWAFLSLWYFSCLANANTEKPFKIPMKYQSAICLHIFTLLHKKQKFGRPTSFQKAWSGWSE